MDLEKTIQDAVSSSIDTVLPGLMHGYIEKLTSRMEEVYSVRTYNLLEASRETGIGYKKLLTAVKRGNLPSMCDGKHYRITHIDLKKWMNSEKNLKIVRK